MAGAYNLKLKRLAAHGLKRPMVAVERRLESIIGADGVVLIFAGYARIAGYVHEAEDMQASILGLLPRSAAASVMLDESELNLLPLRHAHHGLLLALMAVREAVQRAHFTSVTACSEAILVERLDGRSRPQHLVLESFHVSAVWRAHKRRERALLVYATRRVWRSCFLHHADRYDRRHVGL